MSMASSLGYKHNILRDTDLNGDILMLTGVGELLDMS